MLDRDISLAIVTKNRPIELSRCLSSVTKQVVKPLEVIVIDNDENFSAKDVIKDSAFSDLNISYFFCKKNVPGCRNLAIGKAKTKYLAFIDDDCVLTKQWLREGYRIISTKKDVFVLGNSLLLNTNNIFANAQFSRDTYWRIEGFKKSPRSSKEVFDTKNVILDISELKKKKIKFDENCQIGFYDIADFDMGLQLAKFNSLGSYCQEMKLYHEETGRFFRFINRAFARGKLIHFLKGKWQLNNDFVNLKDKIFILWLIRLIKHFSKDFDQYSPYINGGLFTKMLTIVLIRVFERFYVLGYVAKN